MNLSPGLLFCVLFCFVSIFTAFAQESSSAWNALVDEYIDQGVFALNPTSATAAGVHPYDAQLEDLSRAGIENQVAILKKFKQRTLAIDSKSLSPLDSADREMLLGAIRGSLLSLEVIRSWEKDPDPTQRREQHLRHHEPPLCAAR